MLSPLGWCRAQCKNPAVAALISAEVESRPWISLNFVSKMPPKSDSIPKNWPPDIRYLITPTYSKTLSPAHEMTLQTRPKDALPIPPNNTKRPCYLVKITTIISPSHPAVGQSGLFAAKDLKPGTFILQYLGEIHVSPKPLQSENMEEDPHASSNYDLSLDRESRIGIDADEKGNEARFINDYRGVAEKPNAEFKEVWDERRGERGMGVWVLPEGKSGKNKGIKKGEEILVSYGRGFWGARKDFEGDE
jgi:hypothetical protein